MPVQRSHLRRLPLVLALLTLVACGGGGDGATAPVTPVPTSVTVSPTSLTFSYLGETTKVTAQVRDQEGKVMSRTVTFSSSDASVASVASDGTVKAVANGTATITAALEGISASATATVSQKATGLVLVSGGTQQAIADSTLSAPVVVRARDVGGAGVEGVAVTFTPDQGSGSVSAASVTTDAAGEARTEWTLGSAYGPQRLVASADAGQVAVSAIARADHPTADVNVVTGLVVDRPDPSSLESFQVRATLRNDGDLATGPLRVQLRSNDAVVETRDLASIEPDDTVTVDFTLGPLAAGSYALKLVADPDNAVEELNEVNNDATGSVTVVAQAEVATGSSTAVNGSAGKEVLFRVDVPAGAGSVLTVALSGGTGDADLFVQNGGRPSTKNGYKDCLSYGPTTNERCQFASPAGTYNIVLYGFEDFSGSTLTVSLGDAMDPFNIDLVFLNSGTPAQDSAFTRAARRWESILVGDLQDYNLAGTGNTVPSGCVQSQPELPDIDDLLIYVSIDSIDGPSGTLGQAAPCLQRAVNDYSYLGLPFVGVMRFDEADLQVLLELDDLDEVILHEMGHVLGFGTLCQWAVAGTSGCENAQGLLVNPSLPSHKGADTHFTGAHAIQGFDAVGGSSYTHAKVPVENQAGEGSGDSHWRESVFDTELMTPSLDAGRTNALSVVTLMQFMDLGYQVDVTKADSYALPTPFPGASRVAGKRGKIDLRGDVLHAPITVMSPKGKILKVYER